jgi:hypothetical protein
MGKDRDYHKENKAKPGKCKIPVGKNSKGETIFCGTPLVNGRCPQSSH